MLSIENKKLLESIINKSENNELDWELFKSNKVTMGCGDYPKITNRLYCELDNNLFCELELTHYKKILSPTWYIRNDGGELEYSLNVYRRYETGTSGVFNKKELIKYHVKHSCGHVGFLWTETCKACDYDSPKSVKNREEFVLEKLYNSAMKNTIIKLES